MYLHVIELCIIEKVKPTVPLPFNLSSVGRVMITSSNTVAEGNSGEMTFDIVIALQTSSFALGREVAYTVQLTAGTATAGQSLLQCFT